MEPIVIYTADRAIRVVDYLLEQLFFLLTQMDVVLCYVLT